MIERILLIQLRQLGDILLTTPCIREIKRQRPELEVSFLSHPMGRLILEANPFLDEHFIYDESQGIGGALRLAAVLRKRGFSTVIDFMNNPRSGLYTFLTGASRRVGFASSRRFFYTDLLPRPDGSNYIVRDKFELLKKAGFSAKDESLTLPWAEKHTGPLMKLVGENTGFRDASLRIILSPTHRRLERRWPLANYAALADLLIDQWQAYIIWIWGPGEENLIDEVLQLCQRPTCKVPPTTLREMTAIVANCDLFIGNSNGASHVAVAAETMSLQLHGPTMASSWCPTNDLHHAVQAKTMDALSVKQVWAALLHMEQKLVSRAAARKAVSPRVRWNTPL